jgi:Mrp family chromosome partitioning ATPase
MKRIKKVNCSTIIDNFLNILRLFPMPKSCSGDCDKCSLKDTCNSGTVPDQLKDALQYVKNALEAVTKKVLVLSGKGGVGKSTFTYLLARILAQNSFNFGS